jgi:hypothetical protein
VKPQKNTWGSDFQALQRKRLVAAACYSTARSLENQAEQEVFLASLQRSAL